MWHVPSVVNDPWSQIYAPLNGCSDWGRYQSNCKFLLTWLRDGFSWSSHDLHPNIIPANFFWVKSVRWPRFPETFRRLPKISDEFPKTSERCRKLNVRRLFPKTFEHFWHYEPQGRFSCTHQGSLRAIIWENRESHDTRQKIEFFFILSKHPF